MSLQQSRRKTSHMVEVRMHCWWLNKAPLQRKHGQWCRKELFNWQSLNAQALISREEQQQHPENSADILLSAGWSVGVQSATIPRIENAFGLLVFVVNTQRINIKLSSGYTKHTKYLGCFLLLLHNPHLNCREAKQSCSTSASLLSTASVSLYGLQLGQPDEYNADPSCLVNLACHNKGPLWNQHQIPFKTLLNLHARLFVHQHEDAERMMRSRISPFRSIVMQSM